MSKKNSQGSNLLSADSSILQQEPSPVKLLHFILLAVGVGHMCWFRYVRGSCELCVVAALSSQT